LPKTKAAIKKSSLYVAGRIGVASKFWRLGVVFYDAHIQEILLCGSVGLS
jgi:hypothetical protein